MSQLLFINGVRLKNSRDPGIELGKAASYEVALPFELPCRPKLSKSLLYLSYIYPYLRLVYDLLFTGYHSLLLELAAYILLFLYCGKPRCVLELSTLRVLFYYERKNY